MTNKSVMTFLYVNKYLSTYLSICVCVFHNNHVSFNYPEVGIATEINTLE